MRPALRLVLRVEMSDDFRTRESTIRPAWTRPRQVKLRNCMLVVEQGPDAGKRFGPLGDHTTIGHAPDAAIGLNDPEVSKLHCELVRSGDGMRLRDLQSRNGVYVDDVQIDGAVYGRNFAFAIGTSVLRVLFLPGTQKHTITAMDQSGTLVGASPAMRRVFSMLDRIAPEEMSVLLLGETGTGKSAVAEAIHKTSSRKDGPFAVLSCANVSAELIDARLLGHARGAFTGAHTTKKGVFEEGSGGTVFLDEIGELPMWLQSKLLTVLDSGVFRPVGGVRDVRADFRLICATNRDLPLEVRKGQFRQDLYFRVAGITVTVPPLRERVGDLFMLSQWFILREAEKRRAAGRECTVDAITHEAIRVLEKYGWPGNVRELQNVIKNSIAFAKSPELGPEDILMEEWVPNCVCAVEGQSTEPDKPPSNHEPSLAESRAEHDRGYFQALLKRVGGNVSRAAETAGVSRQHIHTMMKKLGVLAPDRGPVRPSDEELVRDFPRPLSGRRDKPRIIRASEFAAMMQDTMRGKEREEK